MANIHPQNVLHHERVDWSGNPSCRFCISQRKLLQIHSRRPHPLLFLSLVHQDLVFAFFPTSRPKCEASGVFMVACVWLYTGNILCLYWRNTLFMPRSVNRIYCDRMLQAFGDIKSECLLKAELCLGCAHGFWE